MPLSAFHPPVAQWFGSALGAPTRCQIRGWKPICNGESTLVLAPTGSGKTLAAFLTAIDRIMWSPQPAKERRCRVLYVSPLKALAVDVERNLRAPIEGIAKVAQEAGVPIRVPRVDIRTGDTSPSDRARMARAAPDILITTPESLYLLLTSRARSTLASVETVIIDEIHALVPSKRGTHLFLSLERLEQLRGAAPPPQRIGLSATQRPLEEISRMLGGFRADGSPRPVTIIDAGEPKRLDLSVEVPDVDMGRLGDTAPSGAEDPSQTGHRASIWPYIHNRVVELIRQHRTTLVFVNSRRLAERVASALNVVAGEEIALAHHGSIAREKRLLIEARLKSGDLPSLVATSSLELGIDMGSVDLVIQLEAPASIASGLQRIGRACHGVGGVPRGVLMAKHRGDLLACAAAAQAIGQASIEETFYPRNPLDVLAQQIVAIATDGPLQVEDVYSLVRRAAPYAELSRGAFDDVLDMLSGRYPSDEFSELRPRITWDRVAGTIKAREGARRIAISNGGTIPDRGLYGVFLPGEGGSSIGGARVGELDEEMVFELRLGEVFLLGASSWRAEEITHDRVVVSPAPGRPGKMPFWHGDRPGRSREFGDKVGKLARTVAVAKEEDAASLLQRDYHLGEHAVRNLIAYVQEQVQATGEVPADQTILVERYVDETGDWRVCVLSPYGLAVHAPWSMAVRARLEARHSGTDVHYTDDGMVFRIPACDEPPSADLFFPSSKDIQEEVTRTLGGTSLFAARFRECAGRSLLLPKRSPTRRTPLWAQRRRAGDLLAVASRFPSFPIVLEAYRECLRDVFDMAALIDVLRRVEMRRIRVTTVDSVAPSPFAGNVLFFFVANFMYLLDAPAAERRAQALSIDQGRLRELLGDTEARELLDPEVIEEHEQRLQGLVHPVRSADGLHDLLLRVGDLSDPEIAARAAEPAAPWIASLHAEGRLIEIPIAGERRRIAVEDAGRYRAALGVALPPGIPGVFLQSDDHPLRSLVARYARTHGPFTARAVAGRFGLPVPAIDAVIAELAQARRVVEGAFLRGQSTIEVCDAEVLRALRARSLARLRQQVEPVEVDAYARFLLHWQGITRKARGSDALMRVVQQMEGCPLAASALESSILPARVAGYTQWNLDSLCASGEVVWVGLEPMGASDARIGLYLSEHERLLAPSPGRAEGDLPGRIRELLTDKGAMFFKDIAREIGGFPGDLIDALWALVWSAELTNDTLEPIRSRLRAAAPQSRHAGARRGPWAGPAGSEGRWSLRAPRCKEPPDAAARMVALARSLLERYGIVVREVAQAEAIAGGFSSIYPVLKALEEGGGVRRGYFVAGRGGAQFAMPGAEEQLRSSRDFDEDAGLIILSAVDPANPYGALLAWPSRADESAAGRAQRVAGARVLLWNGTLLAWLGRSEQGLLTYLPEGEAEREHAARLVARGLATLVDGRRRRALLIPSIDGEPALSSPVAPALVEAGFLRGAQGLLFRRMTGRLAVEAPSDVGDDEEEPL
ncbi:MAG: DEAD/DEAH box helicase [Deltaproteobacteria bacterium]|nr:DEAD/DEAH box helicase [Deltaproteobacteria bacterium]